MKERFAIWLAPQNGERREVAPLRQLGWAFLLAWVFCVFYTNAAGVLSGDAIPDAGEAAAGASSGASSMGAALFYAVLPLAASVATLAAIVLAEPRIGSPTSHRPLFVVAPALTAASTPFMFVSVADPGLNAALFGIGAVATGIGSALLWAMWGEYYAVIPRDRAEWLAPVSAVSAAVIVYPPWTVGCPLPSPRRCRFCPASVSISRGRQKPPAPKRRSQPPIASQPSSAPPWRGSGARGSASSSCSPS